MSQATKTHQQGAALRAAAILPGLPQVLRPDLSPGYAALAGAAATVGARFAELGVERVLYYSTQWISVLGHSFQARQALTGLHVDENWYELCDLPFAFDVDVALAGRLAEAATGAGYQTKLIDYDGFPVDTGTIVAHRLLTEGAGRQLAAGMVSCCVYSDFADTERLARTLAAAVAADGVPTATVVVSGLSGRYFTTDIDSREDHVSSPDDDRWNRRVLDLLAAGRIDELTRLAPEYAAACKVDMGLKGLAWLRGMGAAVEGKKATLHAYGALHGTGAAVVEL
jgi:2-aminophenol/2-amino-5-chlorophenol 1,6-dioxygenase alpha subunit